MLTDERSEGGGMERELGIEELREIYYRNVWMERKLFMTREGERELEMKGWGGRREKLQNEEMQRELLISSFSFSPAFV